MGPPKTAPPKVAKPAAKPVAKPAAPKDAKKDKKAAKKAKKAAKKAALPSCAKLPWYKKWFNTIRAWFSKIKITNCIKAAVKKSKKTMIDLKAKAPKLNVLLSCSKLPWYKRWWNTMKGWFGSKVTNCIKAAVKKSKKTMIMLKAKKVAVLGACSKLPWYKRWFNTIKGWFGSKITKCIKAAVKKSKKTMIDLASKKPKAKKAAKALVLCPKLAW